MKKGKWISGDYWSEGCGMGETYGQYYRCSLCGHVIRHEGLNHCDVNYCPNCGADMRRETDDTK